MKISLSIIFTFLCVYALFSQQPDFSMAGFATLNGGTTGGNGGQVVTPTTFNELKQYVENTSSKLVIRITKEFTTGIPTYVDAEGSIVPSTTLGAIPTTFGAILRVGSNKTLIGVGEKAFLNRIGLVIQCQSNIIIRNIKFTMKNVPATRDGEYKILAYDGINTVGDPDCIGIQADAESVPVAQRFSRNIWIDHCEFFNENIENKDRYDGLIDNKNNTQNLTISWCYFHHHSKALLSGSGNSDAFNRTITFHHNYFSNIDGSRLPLLRFGQHHYFNNYMEDCPGDGVNLRINTNAYIEANYFKNVKKPIFGKPTEFGQGQLVDNIFENCSRLPVGVANINNLKSDPLSSSEEFLKECNFAPSGFYNYTKVLHRVDAVPSIVKAYSGVGKIPDEVVNVDNENLFLDNAYVYNQILYIKAKPQTQLIIYDMNGKIVFKALLVEEYSLIALPLTGVHIIKLVNGNQTDLRKVLF